MKKEQTTRRKEVKTSEAVSYTPFATYKYIASTVEVCLDMEKQTSRDSKARLSCV